VRRIFHDWEDALPRKARKRLERALGRANRVKENLDLACKALQDDLQATIQAAHAPKPGFPLKAVVIGIAATAVVGVGIAAAVIVPPLLREWVTVTVHNNCPNVLEYDASGIEPPQGEIAPFSTQSFEVPAVEASVRRDLVGIEVSALGREFRIPVAPNVMLRLNDRSIPPDFEGGIDLQGREEHQLVMTCP